LADPNPAPCKIAASTEETSWIKLARIAPAGAHDFRIDTSATCDNDPLRHRFLPQLHAEKVYASRYRHAGRISTVPVHDRGTLGHDPRETWPYPSTRHVEDIKRQGSGPIYLDFDRR
jgi:hypothetical protein